MPWRRAECAGASRAMLARECPIAIAYMGGWGGDGGCPSAVVTELSIFLPLGEGGSALARSLPHQLYLCLWGMEGGSSLVRSLPHQLYLHVWGEGGLCPGAVECSTLFCNSHFKQL